MKIKTQMIKDKNKERRVATQCEQNEFLDIRLRIHIQKDDQQQKGNSLRRFQQRDHEYQSPSIKQKTKSYANFVQGNDIESTNKRIKSIIKEMKIKQQEKQLQVKEMMKKIQQEKLEEFKTKEFMLAQRRIKTRIKLLQKRDKLKEDYLNKRNDSISSNSKSNRSDISKSNTKKHLTIMQSEETQQYQRNIKNKKSYLSRMQSQQELSNSKTTMLPNPYTNAKIKTKKYANKHINSTSGIIQPIAKGSEAEKEKLYSSFIKNKRENKTQIELNQHKISERKEVRKRNNGHHLFTIQRKSNMDPEDELICIEKQQQLNIQSARRAASLVQRIGVNHRLKKKNMEQQDYTEASNKLKLLSLLYKVQQS